MNKNENLDKDKILKYVNEFDYKNGLDRSIKFLMGQIMKETKGKANPKLANDMLIEELNNIK